MRTSVDRILTTHVGSLPRPPELLPLLQAGSRGEAVDQAQLDAQLDAAVRDVVAHQVEAGIDVVSDGEMSKIAYSFYVRRCLTGLAPGAPGSGAGAENADFTAHPDFAAQVRRRSGTLGQRVDLPVCNGPVRYHDLAPLTADLTRLRKAAVSAAPLEAFVPSASPGVLVRFVRNDFFPDEDAFLDALADAMRTEFEAIHAAGFILQVDCPDLASARSNQYQHLSDEEFLVVARRHVEVLNHAIRNIPPNAIRLHLCWGNYEGPHTHDIPFRKIASIAFASRAQAISFEAANPRHEHEWEDFLEGGVPDDRIVIPGVIDSTTNFVEHPQLVAQRICNWARVVGRERVIAGADCGFGTFASSEPMVAPSVVWAKFRALAEGAEIATNRLWR